MRIFSHRHENLFSWARESRLFVTPRGRTRIGGFVYTVNPETPSRPGQTSFSWMQEVFLMCTEREFHSDGFVFSRLTVAACPLPAGNKAHRPDFSLSTAIFRFKGRADTPPAVCIFFFRTVAYRAQREVVPSGTTPPVSCRTPPAYALACAAREASSPPSKIRRFSRAESVVLSTTGFPSTVTVKIPSPSIALRSPFMSISAFSAMAS